MRLGVTDEKGVPPVGSLPQPRLHPNHENVRETPAQGRPANTPQGHREQGWAEDLQDREEPKGTWKPNGTWHPGWDRGQIQDTGKHEGTLNKARFRNNTATSAHCDSSHASEGVFTIFLST